MANREVYVTRVYRELVAANSETIVLIGGSRSSKTHSLCQRYIELLVSQPGKNFLLTRKTLRALKNSGLRQLLSILDDYGVEYTHHKVDGYIEYEHPDGWKNRIDYCGLDDPRKILSTEYNYIWLHEANEFTWDDYKMLKTRLSGHCEPGDKNQIFIDLNPTEIRLFKNASLKSSPRQATSPVDTISTPKTGSDPFNREKEN